MLFDFLLQKYFNFRKLILNYPKNNDQLMTKFPNFPKAIFGEELIKKFIILSYHFCIFYLWNTKR